MPVRFHADRQECAPFTSTSYCHFPARTFIKTFECSSSYIINGIGVFRKHIPKGQILALPHYYTFSIRQEEGGDLDARVQGIGEIAASPLVRVGTPRDDKRADSTPMRV